MTANTTVPPIIFDELVEEMGFNPLSPKALVVPAPTKRQRQKAGRLANKVWRAISTDPTTDTSTLTVTTQELPVVS